MARALHAINSVKVFHAFDLDLPAKNSSNSGYVQLVKVIMTFENLYRAMRASLVFQMVKNSSSMGETWVHFLGCEDPLEEGMVTHSSIPPWRIPMDIRAW